MSHVLERLLAAEASQKDVLTALSLVPSLTNQLSRHDPRSHPFLE